MTTTRCALLCELVYIKSKFLNMMFARRAALIRRKFSQTPTDASDSSASTWKAADASTLKKREYV